MAAQSTSWYMLVRGSFTDLPLFLSGYQAAVEALLRQFGGRYPSLRAGTGEFQVVLVDGPLDANPFP